MAAPASLLLLPPPPFPATYTSLRRAYGHAFTQVLVELAAEESPSGRATALEIAYLCPHVQGDATVPRGQLFAQTQELVESLYRLVCVIAAKEGIDGEGPAGVDVRVLLLAAVGEPATPDEIRVLNPPGLGGPIIDLHTLAASARPWRRIYVPHGKPGDAVLRAFLNRIDRLLGKERPPWTIQRLEADLDGLQPAAAEAAVADEAHGNEDEGARHVTVAVGGTFDHLHAGHKLLLTMALLLLEPATSAKATERRMVVGVTGDALLENKKYAEFLDDWPTRQASVASFVQAIADFRPPSARGPAATETSIAATALHGRAASTTLGPALRLECVEISDPFGPTITDESISALVVSAETRSGGDAVNGKRAELGWAGLAIYEVDVLFALEEGEGGQDARVERSFESKISSTAIRRDCSERARPARHVGST
ncbi:MAG: hypothetical protein M1838_005674 [Thelocarpon superellum]|nr:MAG: hypothetical protein M1838_005674 [Thelocarpon superellum]